MLTDRIDPEVIEAAGRAIGRMLDPPVGDLDPVIDQEDLEAAAEAAIRAADEKRGLRVEARGCSDLYDYPAYRYISDWRSVEGEVDA